MSSDLTLTREAIPKPKGLMGRLGWIHRASPDARAFASEARRLRIHREFQKATATIRLAAGPQSSFADPTPYISLSVALAQLITTLDKWPDQAQPVAGHAAHTIKSSLITIGRHLDAREASPYLKGPNCSASMERAVRALTTLIEVDNRRHARSSLSNFEHGLRALEQQPTLKELGR